MRNFERKVNLSTKKLRNSKTIHIFDKISMIFKFGILRQKAFICHNFRSPSFWPETPYVPLDTREKRKWNWAKILVTSFRIKKKLERPAPSWSVKNTNRYFPDTYIGNPVRQKCVKVKNSGRKMSLISVISHMPNGVTFRIFRIPKWRPPDGNTYIVGA